MEFEHLRPLGVGELLDACFRLYRRRFGTLVGAVAIFTVPLGLLQLVVNLSTPTTTRTVNGPGFTYRTTTTSSGTQLAVLLIGLLIGAVSTALAEGAAMRIVGDEYLATTTTWKESIRFALRRFPSILWVVVLAGICWILASFACILPGVYLYVSFSVVIPVLLVEDVRGSRSLGRARELVSGRWWPTFATLLVATMITLTLTWLGTILVGGGSVLFTRPTGATGTRVAVGLVAALITVFTTPISASLRTLIYFDLRVRKEGFDLALMMQRLPEHQPGTGPSDAGRNAATGGSVVTPSFPATAPAPAAGASPWARADRAEAWPPPVVVPPPTDSTPTAEPRAE